MRDDVTFLSDGVRCAAWHYRADGDGPRPCVVMAHGFGGTRTSGLEGFAEAFCAAGYDVLLFDYRFLGASEGEPRQLVDPPRQRADYHAAIAFARGLEDVDRIVLWGCSLAGGHVLQVGAEDGRMAAVVSVTPGADGLAILVNNTKNAGPVAGLKLSAAGVRGLLAARRGDAPVTVPIVGPPGSLAVLTAPGSEAAMRELAGDGWVNEVVAAPLLMIATNRPVNAASGLRCPVLVQVADEDQTVPPRACMKAAWEARAVVHHYLCDHFDVYTGREWFDRVLEDQLAFLARVLTPELADAFSG